MKKQRVSSSGVGRLFVCVKHEKDVGPVGGTQNPSIGWVVYMIGVPLGRSPRNLSPIFKSSRKAKKWAEERYRIKGWTSTSGGPYHQMYAIPEED